VTCKAARKVRVLVENQKRNKIALEKSRHLGIQRHFTRRETAQKAYILCVVFAAVIVLTMPFCTVVVVDDVGFNMSFSAPRT